MPYTQNKPSSALLAVEALRHANKSPYSMQDAYAGVQYTPDLFTLPVNHDYRYSQHMSGTHVSRHVVASKPRKSTPWYVTHGNTLCWVASVAQVVFYAWLSVHIGGGAK